MLQQKTAKSILNKHKKRDSWFLDDYSVNPYEGCSCNCQYCYIRGSKYGENMEEKLAVKTNALEVLEKQLRNRARKKEYGIVVVGSATDTYIQHEASYKITKGMLELLLKYRFPVFISTKSTLITRDIELLKAIDAAAILPDDLKDKLKHGVILSVSISSMDENISNTLEPGAATPVQRLEILQQLKSEGFLVGVNAIPVLPYISDTEEELEKITAASRAYGADYILVGGLTLFGNEAADSKTLFYKFLKRYNPALIEKYDLLYSRNFYAAKYYQQELKKRADKICKAYQLRTSIIEE
ncbi:MAG: radical SAM protein [Bacteroidota bacterium]